MRARGELPGEEEVGLVLLVSKASKASKVSKAVRKASKVSKVSKVSILTHTHLRGDGLLGICPGLLGELVAVSTRVSVGEQPT